tara:strand:+ start:2881 stop:3351 length:471 start_codon:yes stop_codon:yes gene_type:complete
MATVNANTCAIYIDTAGGAFDADPADTAGASPSLDPVAFSTSASISVTNSTFEATSISDPSNATTVRDFAVGTTSTSLSFEGVLDFEAVGQTVDVSAIFTALLAKDKITAVWASTDDNAEAYGGKGFLTSFEINSSVDDFATYSGTVELDGDPSKV